MPQEQFRAMMEEYQAQQIALAGPEINSIAVRLPNFWVTSPELWFAQVEANFDTRHPKITVDSSKYNHVLQVLPQEVLTEVRDAIHYH